MEQLVKDLKEIASELKTVPATDAGDNLERIRDLAAKGFNTIADTIEESQKAYNTAQAPQPPTPAPTPVTDPPPAPTPAPEPPAPAVAPEGSAA